MKTNIITATTTAAAALLALVITGASAEEPGMGPEGMYKQGSYKGIPWISGGVGENERNYLLEHHAADHNLKLEFAVTGGAYLGDIDVTITKPDGEIVMQAPSEGPWFMTKLPAGTYQVQASGFDQTFERTVSVPASGLETVVISQWTKEQVAKETPGPGF
jgi:hypothetical protein